MLIANNQLSITCMILLRPRVVCNTTWKLCVRSKRLFAVGTLGITTYNPTTLEITNQVCYCYKVHVHASSTKSLNTRYTDSNEYVVECRGIVRVRVHVDVDSMCAQWPYSDVAALMPTQKAGATLNELVLTLRTAARKTEQIRFSCEQRAELITDALVRAPPLATAASGIGISKGIGK